MKRTFLWMPALAFLIAGCGPSKQGGGADTASSPGASGDAAASNTPEPSGPTAPSFTLPTLDGGNVSLSDYEGDKVVLIDFWSTTCDPCLAEMPELEKLYQEKKSEGFVILGISTDGPQTMSNVSSTVQKIGMSFPILLDEETAVMDRYNPKGELPFAVVVDRNGRIVLKRASYQAGDKESMRTLVEAIDEALARK